MDIQAYSLGNQNNNAFYETLKATGLQHFAEKGGLATGCDVHMLTPYWHDAHTILEVGAGYGRVIDALLREGFQGNVYAVERCDTLYQSLEQKYHQCPTVTTIHLDARYLTDLNASFDVILLLWSAFADFSVTEQPVILQTLASLLNKNGTIVIDTMPENLIPLQASSHDKQVYVTQFNEAKVYTYEPTGQEMDRYVRLADLKVIERLTCFTDIGRPRWLYILK